MARRYRDCAIQLHERGLCTIDLACLASIRKKGGNDFHGGTIIVQVNNLLVEPRTLLVLTTISYMNFLENSSHFVDAPERYLVETFS